LTVAEIIGLRRQMKGANAEYKVVKNTLTNIAASGTPIESARKYFTGPTGIVIAYGDPVEMTKKVLDFADKNEKFRIKSGIIEGRLCSFDEMKEISVLPSRMTLLGMLGGALGSPMVKLAFSLNQTVNQFVRALESLRNNREKSGGM
jgi:ribosomal protein L10